MSSPSTVRSPQRILDLQCDQRCPTPKMREHLSLRHFPRGRVRETDVAYLARSHQVVERTHCLLNRGKPVPIVQVIQVDVVGLQTPEGLVTLREDRFSARAPAVRVASKKIDKELRRDHRAIPTVFALCEEVTDDLFGVAPRVTVRRVDEVAAGVKVAGENRFRVGDA